MKRLSLLLIVCTLWSVQSNAQFTAVTYDIERNYFNEGQPLPAEKPLLLSGKVPANVNIIEISFFPSKAKDDKDLLYVASWKDIDNTTNQDFNLAINYPLRASEKYDFRLDYFVKLSPGAQTDLATQITEQATAYLEANLNIDGNEIKVDRREKKIVDEIEAIIERALADYRNQNDIGFQGLSQTLRQKLESLDKTELNKIKQDSTLEAQQAKRQQMLEKELGQLKEIVRNEIRDLMSSPWSKLSLSRYVDDYETEKKNGYFSLSIGYGGVYLSGGSDGNFHYDASPYAGIAFPLSNSTVAPKFLRDFSIVLGAFWNNFEDENGKEITGILINRPTYLGLDYRLFEFIHFNAGATFLEKETLMIQDNGMEEAVTDLMVRPFVGLSARINLSVGFGR